MTHAALTKDLVADPTLWRMILRIDTQRLSALLIGPESVERSVIFHSEELADESVKSLENIVYDNPLLLSDFSSIDVIFSTSEFFLAPKGTDVIREKMAEALLPDYYELRRIETDGFPGGELCYSVGTDLFNFVTRTFACARFHHSLAINATYLSHRNAAASDSAHLFALCEANEEMSVIVFDLLGRISHLTIRRPAEANDAAYYILVAASGAEPLSVGGAPEVRNSVCNVLQTVRPSSRILPLTLPEDLLHTRRLAPGATFDMIFLTQL